MIWSEIQQNFEREDFITKASVIFSQFKYTWASKDGSKEYIPSRKEIEELVISLEETATKAEAAECGRIRIEYDKEAEMFEYYFNL